MWTSSFSLSSFTQSTAEAPSQAKVTSRRKLKGTLDPKQQAVADLLDKAGY
jgi:hypothetical protein